MIIRLNSCSQKISHIFFLVSPNNHLNINNIRRNSYYKHNYSEQMEAAVNIQIQTEQQAAQNYLNIAVAFLHPYMSRPGAGGYFMRMYEEEIGHMQDFIRYQLLRGGYPIINSISAPNPKCNITLLEAFCQALEMEKDVTVTLENLLSLAEKVKDVHCADFVTSVFMAEQMKSINEMSLHVSQLSRICDNEHAIYNYDLELAKNYPYTIKSGP